MQENNNTKILHLCHGLYGENNGVDRYISTFVSEIEATHYIAVPKGINKSTLDNVCELDSLKEIPRLVKNLEIDFLIIHYTGAECFTEDLSSNWIKLGDKFLTTSKKFIDIDLSPFAYPDVSTLFDENKKHHTIIITHSEYKLPDYLTKSEVDFIVYVSRKCKNNNTHLDIPNQVIYPCFNQKFFNLIHTKKSKKIRIGWLGRMNKYDNQIYKFLKKEYGHRKDLQFIFAGHGRIDYKSCIPKNFKFVGNISAEKFFENIDIFLYPTTVDSFSLSLLEAMVQNKICISSEVTEDLNRLGEIYVYRNEVELKERLDYSIYIYPNMYLRSRIMAINLFSPLTFSADFKILFSNLKK